MAATASEDLVVSLCCLACLDLAAKENVNGKAQYFYVLQPADRPTQLVSILDIDRNTDNYILDKIEIQTNTKDIAGQSTTESTQLLCPF